AARSAVAFAPVASGEPAAPPALPAVGQPPDYERWLTGVESARARSRVPAAIVASGLEGTEPDVVLSDRVSGGAAKGPRDLDLPPGTKGRYGSAVGRAVHAALQVVDLASGDGIDQAVAAQCVAEGVLDQQPLVHALVTAALGSELVARAAS